MVPTRLASSSSKVHAIKEAFHADGPSDGRKASCTGEEAADKTIRSRMQAWESERKAAQTKFQTRTYLLGFSVFGLGAQCWMVGGFTKHRFVLPPGIGPAIPTTPGLALAGDVLYGPHGCPRFEFVVLQKALAWPFVCGTV